MKEDILEQIAEDYLQALGYFTRHNIKFKPLTTRNDYSPNVDAVASDIDILGFNPKLRGKRRVVVVTCKSWQHGFSVQSELTALKENKRRSGRDAWKRFRELTMPKWSEGFREAIRRETGSRVFTYVTAVTRCIGDRKKWERERQFRNALGGNPIKIISLPEMVSKILETTTTTPAGSDIGRTLQLLKASGVLEASDVLENRNAEKATAGQQLKLPAKPAQRRRLRAAKGSTRGASR
jgi:hypothetical protein